MSKTSFANKCYFVALKMLFSRVKCTNGLKTCRSVHLGSRILKIYLWIPKLIKWYIIGSRRRGKRTWHAFLQLTSLVLSSHTNRSVFPSTLCPHFDVACRRSAPPPANTSSSIHSFVQRGSFSPLSRCTDKSAATCQCSKKIDSPRIYHCYFILSPRHRMRSHLQ